MTDIFGRMIHIESDLKKYVILKLKAGLEGFGPSTTGLRVRCATWLRHRPTKMDKPRVVINLEFVKLKKI